PWWNARPQKRLVPADKLRDGSQSGLTGWRQVVICWSLRIVLDDRPNHRTRGSPVKVERNRPSAEVRLVWRDLPAGENELPEAEHVLAHHFAVGPIGRNLIHRGIDEVAALTVTPRDL